MGQLQILDWQKPDAAPAFTTRSKLATPFEQAVIDTIGLRHWATTQPPYPGSRAEEQWTTRARRRALGEIRAVLLSQRLASTPIMDALDLTGTVARDAAANAMSRAGKKTAPGALAPIPIAWGVTGDLTRDNWIIRSAHRDALAILFSWRARGERGQRILRHVAIIEQAGNLGALLLDMAASKAPGAVEMWTDFVKERHGALLALEKDKAADRLPQLTGEHFQVFAPVEVPHAR